MSSALLSEIGHVRVELSNGSELTFIPSLARIAEIGDGGEIIGYFADLHDERPGRAIRAARRVLMCLCKEGPEAALVYTGWVQLPADPSEKEITFPGLVSEAEACGLARHLMLHGLTGKARPGKRNEVRGKYAETFSVADHVAATMIHLGRSRDEVLDMTMSEIQNLVETKFPDTKRKDLPSRDEYYAQMNAILEKRKQRKN